MTLLDQIRIQYRDIRVDGRLWALGRFADTALEDAGRLHSDHKDNVVPVILEKPDE
jgi:hypothetical protein